MLTKTRFIQLLLTAILALLIPTQSAQGQREGDAGDVLRINTELVQTNIMVLDKQGRFIDGLKKEDFELRVDGRDVAVSFFESIQAGSRREQMLRPARGERMLADAAASSSSQPRRRTIIFFIDDLHLSLDSMGRTRKMLSDFIEKEMGEDDMVAIASSSGQIGFLQQYTDNKDVLRAAVSRLVQLPYAVRDTARGAGAVMTEYMALVIERRSDPGVFNFFVQDCLAWVPKGSRRNNNPRLSCEQEVRNRARLLLLQSGQVVSNTYHSLEALLRSAERLPGSKLAFFVSDGFLADAGPRGSTSYDKLGPITDEARRAGVVIYTIDARGLVSNQLDATNNVAYDPDGIMANSASREVAATQDALNALASDTGGRALRNQNYFDSFINEALEETSRYYLLAWRPEPFEQKNEKFRKIEVSIKGRPELKVQTARGFFNSRPPVLANESAAKTEKPKDNADEEKKPDSDLWRVLSDSNPSGGLPLQLSLLYLDTPASGTMLTSSVQAPAELLSYGPDGTEHGALTLAGVILDDKGKPAASFRTGLKVNPPGTYKTAQATSDVIYNYRTPLKPGLYQVRVAARDDRSGILGSSTQWIMIPDLSRGELSLSSLILGIETLKGNGSQAEQVRWSVDKKFAHGSHLRFMIFIYNGRGTGNSMPRLSAQVQVYRDGRAVISTPFKTVSPEAGSDPARIPFTADLNLGSLSAGRYTLRVNIDDLTTGKTISRQTPFYIR